MILLMDAQHGFKFSPESLIEAAKEEGISVTDVIKLVEYCGD